jgi:hypothetical protein
LLPIEESEEEWADEGVAGVAGQTKIGENNNEQAEKAVDDHDLEKYFEAEVPEGEGEEGEEYHAEEGDNDYRGMRDEDEEDTFYDVEGIFYYEDDEEDMYYALEETEEQ